MKAAHLAVILAMATGSTLMVAQGQGASDARVVRLQPDAVAPVTAFSGERLRLQWAGLGPDAVLVGVGHVPASGEREVTAFSDTTYTIISGDGPAARLLSVAVTISDARGAAEDEAPGFNRYVNTLKATIAGKAFPALVQGVANLLQDRCGYAVRGDHLPNQPHYTVFTNLADAGPSYASCFSSPPGFNPSTRKLRTSLLVRLTPTGEQQVHAEVGALALWRYAQEKEWREFPDQGAYQRTISAELRTRMEELR